ncbi:DUF21 domain-containing protein [bacterium]|nr:DUF21 domain-containing protein [bacterium]
MVIHIYIVLIPLVLLLGALFAAAEAALFSLSQTQLESLRRSRPSTYRAINALIRRPDELLSTIVVGNEALSILVGTFVVSLLEFYFGKWNETATSLLGFSRRLSCCSFFRNFTQSARISNASTDCISFGSSSNLDPCIPHPIQKTTAGDR